MYKWKPNKQELQEWIEKQEARENFINKHKDLFDMVTITKNKNTFYYQQWRISTHSKSKYSNKIENIEYDLNNMGNNLVTNSFKNMVKILAKIKKIDLKEEELTNLK